MKLGHVDLYGTKVKANASRNKAMSYRRMREKEEQLAPEVAELLRRAGEVDDEEDRRYGEDQRGDELPELVDPVADRSSVLCVASSGAMGIHALAGVQVNAGPTS